MSHLDCAFWHGDFGFLIDRSHHEVASTTQSTAFCDKAIADQLEASGRLPSLNYAPVASWLLPRLAEATSGGINLDDGERLHGDGGSISLRWVAFTREFKPRAFFTIRCYSNRIVMSGSCMPNTQSDDLVTAFLAPLIDQPNEIRPLRVSVTDTDPPKAPGTLGRSYVFGWDGNKFLGTREYD